MMTAPTVQTIPSQVHGSSIPPSVLIIGKKRASEYLAPALFRIHSTGGLEIRARGSLSISTAVDVAELVRRSVGHLAIRSISVGTEELPFDGSIRRMSTIQIALSKEQEPVIVANLPEPVAAVEAEVEEVRNDCSAEDIVQATVAATAFVEQDPALVVDRLLVAAAAAPEKKKRAVRASPAKKTRKKKTA